MLAQIRNSRCFRIANLVLLGGLAVSLSSCATKPEPQIVSGQPGRESQLPWNEQEKWESQGQFGPMADRLNSGR